MCLLLSGRDGNIKRPDTEVMWMSPYEYIKTYLYLVPANYPGLSPSLDTDCCHTKYLTTITIQGHHSPSPGGLTNPAIMSSKNKRLVWRFFPVKEIWLSSTLYGDLGSNLHYRQRQSSLLTTQYSCKDSNLTRSGNQKWELNVSQLRLWWLVPCTGCISGEF